MSNPDSLRMEVQVLKISGGRKLYHYVFEDDTDPESNTPPNVPFPVETEEAIATEPEDSIP